ncbi:MAG: nucleotidyltransferase family protein [Anderseniella sp.]|nr:nucleotidyltransferase family protein [Anderseniella sp.]
MSTLAGIILAAGTSSRFGAANKLLADWHGQPMARTVAEAALATELDPVIVVTGHQADEVAAALAGLDVLFVHNASFADGQAGSLKTGISAVPEWCDGAMVLLGDMPRVCAGEINALIDAFADESAIVVPTYQGQRGNPVIIGRAHFPALQRLSGDTGARDLLRAAGVTRVEMDTDAILADYDTPEALP